MQRSNHCDHDFQAATRPGRHQTHTPGKPIEEVQREYGLTDVIELASNENPLGPSPKVVAALQRR